MANTIKVKRSAVAGKVPAVGDLQLGELAINTYDGKLFLKKNVSGNESIVDVTAGGLDAQSLLNLIKTVDGSGSELDADLLDGLNSSATNLASTIVARDASGLTGLAGVNFDGTAAVTGAAGRLWYDGTTGQLNFSHDGIVTQQVGEETYVYAKASAAITEGQVVVRTGAVGQSGSITVAPAGASLTSSDTIVGVATQNAAIGAFCRITVFGVVRGLNTTGQPVGETWADGDVLYYSPSGSGALTKIKPTSPNAKCVIATIISAHQSTGSIQVEIQRGSTLGGTDSNVEITSVADKDFLIYNGTNGRWENKQLVLGTDTTGNYVATIAGTSNQITVSGSGSESSAVTLSLPQDIATTSTPTFAGLNIGAVTMSEYIADTVGAMVTSNTESGISVTYDDADNTLDFDVADFTITLTGDVTGTGTVTNLGNVSFATTIAANSVALGTDTTGNYVADVTAGSYITKTGTAGEGWSPTIAVDATSANTASKVVARDASGNFSAGTITATLSGNASTASSAVELSTPDLRSTSLTPSYFGQGLNTAFMSNSTDGLADGGTYHGIVQFQQWTDASGGGSHQLGFTDNNNVWHRGSSGALTSWAAWAKFLDSSNYNSYSPTLTGTGASGTWGINITGNAATATKLETARTINGTSFDGSANITITANTTNPLTLGTGLTGTSFNGSAAVTAAVSYGTTAGTACQGNDSRLSDSRPANGGNSDTVDNLHASSFLRSDAGTTFSGGVLQVTTPAGSLGSNTGSVNTLQIYQATVNTDAFQTFHVAGDYAVHFGLDGTTNDLFVGGWSAGAVKNKIWHAGNDGSSSGLDADLLDGLHAATANTASTVVARDASGNFSAGTITAALSGNAATATKLATARTISLSGDVTGSVSFDGSGNADIAATIAANSVVLGTDTTGNYVASITNGSYITGGNGGSEGAALTLAVDATSANTASKVVARDASGNFSAGTITASLSGNATTASSTPNPTFSNDAVSKDNITTRTETGFYESSTGTLAEGWPTDSNNWHHLIACTHSNDANYYSMQLSSTFFDQNLYHRVTNGSGTTAWSKVLTDTNASGINVQFKSLGVGTAASGTTGEIRATNQVVAYYSDDRLKTKLGTIENALDKVMSLEGFYYEANQTAQDLGYEAKREVGVSAQSVQAVLPEVVKEAPISDEYLTVQYERLVPLLIQAIKEQQLQIEELKKLINK